LQHQPRPGPLHITLEHNPGLLLHWLIPSTTLHTHLHWTHQSPQGWLQLTTTWQQHTVYRCLSAASATNCNFMQNAVQMSTSDGQININCH